MQWYVVFRSHDTDVISDVTLVRVWARSPLAAVAKARREGHVAHDWLLAVAKPWPKGVSFEDAFVAARKVGSL